MPELDARYYQIAFLSLFLLLGVGTRDWTLHPAMIGIAIATCLLTQALAVTLRHRFVPPTEPAPPPILQSLPSALISSLGLSLLLCTDQPLTMMLAAIAAILSKFLVQWQGKHLFNPANIGIITAVSLTPHAWISPGQWGEETWYALLFLGAGGVVLSRVGRWDTTVAFLASYASLEAARNIWLGWTWDVWLHRLSSGSLLLFALFMVTDPRSIPNARNARLLWAIAIALLTFVLRNVFFVPTAVFWALFALSPLTPLLDSLWRSPRFTWQPTPPPSVPQSP